MSNFHINIHSGASNQKGAALIISLMMLVVMTILAVSAVTTTTMEEKMAGITRNKHMSFQAAESALRDGEDRLGGYTGLKNFDDTGGTGTGREREPDEDPSWELVSWSPSTNGCTGCIPAETAINGTATQPKYIVEHVKTVLSDDDRLNLNNIGVDTGAGKTQVFRVTAFGVGGTDSARVMLQSTYGVRY